MNKEFMRTELEKLMYAKLQSDEQVRNLLELIDTAAKPDSKLNASDCAKLVSSAIAVNDRLKDQEDAARKALHRVLIKEATKGKRAVEHSDIVDSLDLP